MRATTLIIVAFVLTSTCIITTQSGTVQNEPHDILHSISAQTSTRKDATINYLEALYSANEGAFYSSLSDWPTDPRIHIHHTLVDVYQPLSTLILLNAESAFDLTNCTTFAINLLNEESKVDYFGPVNFSADTPSSAAACRGAVELFSQLGILDLLNQDETLNFIKYCQGPNGGFGDNTWDTPLIENLISTHSALYTMDVLGALDDIDAISALSFIQSLYSGGGFSYSQGEEIELSSIPLGLMSLEILDALDSINKEEVVSYILSSWDNNSGTVLDGNIVDAERAIWSLELLDAVDRIDNEAVVTWVLSRQSNAYGEFLPFYGAELEDERYVWTRAAVHILAILNRLDVLDQEFTVLMTPVHTIPQAYYDYIAEHVETTPTTSSGPYFPYIPPFDWARFLANLWPALVILVIISPILFMGYNDRQNKRARAEAKKKRKPGYR